MAGTARRSTSGQLGNVEHRGRRAARGHEEYRLELDRGRWRPGTGWRQVNEIQTRVESTRQMTTADIDLQTGGVGPFAGRQRRPSTTRRRTLDSPSYGNDHHHPRHRRHHPVGQAQHAHTDHLHVEPPARMTGTPPASSSMSAGVKKIYDELTRVFGTGAYLDASGGWSHMGWFNRRYVGTTTWSQHTWAKRWTSAPTMG